MREINVNIGEEYQVKVLKKPDQNDLFYPAYVQAAKEVKEIVYDTKNYYDNVNNNELLNHLDHSNNIIAFNGDRGQGKSSAMLSFSNFLKFRDGETMKMLFEDDLIIAKANIVALSRIDPTKFEKSENILMVILAKLFHQFIELWNGFEDKTLAMKENILQQFETCYTGIKALKGISEPDEGIIGTDLERLRRIGDSENLKRDFLGLIQSFFTFYCKKNNLQDDRSNNFLVIQLDDTDLEVEHAKEIVEDIRKYFMLPNVIVLMAVDIDQLIYAIEQGYIKQFTVLQEDYNTTHPIKYHKIAVKYIEKLIPGKRNIELPKLRATTQDYPERIKLKYFDTEKRKNILEFKYNAEKETSNRDGADKGYIDDIQELVLRYIYEKTGLVFVKPENELHYIVPRTMRSLVNLLSILHGMENAILIQGQKFSATALETRLNNIETFENYFISTWVPNHVNIQFLHIVNSFIDAPWSMKSKRLLHDLQLTFTTNSNVPKTYEKSQEGDRFTTQISKSLQAESEIVPIGNVLDILSLLESLWPEPAVSKLVFTFRTLYSIISSKMLCNDLIMETNNVDYDRYTIMDFFGGNIFGDVSSRFIRKANNKYERAVYEVNIKTKKNNSEPRDVKDLKIINNRELSDSELFCLAIFYDFLFPNSDKEHIKEYRNKLQIDGNSAVSTHFRFNVAHPFLYLYQPDLALTKVPLAKELKLGDLCEDKQDLYTLEDRYTAINIISSIDLIDLIRRQAPDLSLVRSKQFWNYAQYLDDFFVRIQEIIDSIQYLPLASSMQFVRKCIAANTELFNNLFAYYIAEKDIGSDILLIKNLEKLRRLQESQTYEEIKVKMLEIDGYIPIVKEYQSGSLNRFITDYETAKMEIRIKHGTIDGKKEREKFQTPCNKLIYRINKLLDEYQK